MKHDTLDLIEKIALYSEEDDKMPRWVWKAKCACGREWYGTEERVRNSHKWHREASHEQAV